MIFYYVTLFALNLILGLNLLAMDPNRLSYPDYSLAGQPHLNLAKQIVSDSTNPEEDDLVEDLYDDSLYHGNVTYDNCTYTKGSFYADSYMRGVMSGRYKAGVNIFDCSNADEVYEITFYDDRKIVIRISSKIFWNYIRPRIFRMKARNSNQITVRRVKKSDLNYANVLSPLEASLPVGFVINAEIEAASVEKLSPHGESSLLIQENNNINFLNIASIVTPLVTIFAYSTEIKNELNKIKNKIKDISKKYVTKKNVAAGCAFCGAAYFANLKGKTSEFAQGTLIATCLGACAYKYFNKKPLKK